MIIESQSDIIVGVRHALLKNGEASSQLTLRNGSLLVVAESALALYRSAESLEDPLGNGLVAMEDIPTASRLLQKEGFVKEYQAGYIGLHDDKVILITPNDIQLFSSKFDALRNQNEIVRLQLAGIDSE